MPKSLYVIAAMGLVSCLALSFMMKHLVDEREDSAQHPMAREVQELFGARLEGTVGLQWQEQDGIRVAVLTITPAAGFPRDRLAKDMAHYVWRRLELEDRPERFEVECLSPRGGERVVIPVSAPVLRGGSRASPRPDKAPRPAGP